MPTDELYACPASAAADRGRSATAQHRPRERLTLLGVLLAGLLTGCGSTQPAPMTAQEKGTSKAADACNTAFPFAKSLADASGGAAVQRATSAEPLALEASRFDGHWTELHDKLTHYAAQMKTKGLEPLFAEQPSLDTPAVRASMHQYLDSVLAGNAEALRIVCRKAAVGSPDEARFN